MDAIFDNERLVKDGKVAVIISPGYGAGWSTWSSKYGEAKLFCKEMAECILSGDGNRDEIAKRLFPDCYNSTEQLKVVWVEIGDRFKVEEHDGSERICNFGRDDCYVA